MPADPSIAGKIGGSRNTPAQQEARRRNGFQNRGNLKPRVAAPKPEPPSEVVKEPAPPPLTSYPEYSIYRKAKSRCTNRNAECWKDYGGRGIEFRFTSFEEFYKHLGPRPTPAHSLDRYPNNDGHYEPGNVRWATPAEQSANRRPRTCTTAPQIPFDEFNQEESTDDFTE